MTTTQIARIERAKALVDQYKLNRPCALCGKVASSPDQAQFFAKPGAKPGRPVSKLVCSGASPTRLIAEIANRDLLCMNCAATRQMRAASQRVALQRVALQPASTVVPQSAQPAP